MGTIQENVDYMIVNYNSGLTWAVQGNDPNPGNSVVQFSWVIDPNQYNQRWNFEQTDGGWRIRTPPSFSGLYCAIDKGRGTYDNNAGVNVYSGIGLDRDVWILSDNEVGAWISITNLASAKSCDVLGESTGNEAYIVQYDPIAQSGQRWAILPYTGLVP